MKQLHSAQFPSRHGRDADPTATGDNTGQTATAALLGASAVGPSARNRGILPMETPLPEPAFTPFASRSSDFHLPPKKHV